MSTVSKIVHNSDGLLRIICRKYLAVSKIVHTHRIFVVVERDVSCFSILNTQLQTD